MEVSVSGHVMYVDVSDYGWIGVIHSIGSFQAATLSELIELVKLVVSRF